MIRFRGKVAVVDMSVADFTDAVDCSKVVQNIERRLGGRQAEAGGTGKILRCKGRRQGAWHQVGIGGQAINADIVRQSGRNPVAARRAALLVPAPAVQVPEFLHVDQQNPDAQVWMGEI